jgi:iron complex transport system substrate-binding protein
MLKAIPMRSIKKLLTFTCLSISTSFTFAHHNSANIEHAQGVQVISNVPQKVATFDLATLDTMDTLGIDVFGLPKALAKEHLAKYNTPKYTNIGSLFEPDYEVIAASQPDLVIVAARSAKAYDNLSELAPTIDLTIDTANYLNQVKKVSHSIADIFHKQALLETKLNEIDANIATVQQLASKAGNGLIILTNGGKITAYGPNSRFGWLHNDLSITPAISAISAATHGDPISFEFILQTDPDWLFVIDRDAAIGKQGAAKALLDNPLINKTKAAKNEHIVYLNSFNWYILSGGLNALAKSVDEVLAALQQ